jgi:threonine aldolase
MTSPATIDLRSDTVTRPTPAMRRAMAEAEVGDDVYREDPSTRALEERAAAVLGKEAALFVPSGTMANQIAMMIHCRPGDEVVAPRDAHVRLYESGGAAAWAGVQVAEAGSGGILDVADLESVAQTSDAYYLPRTRLVVIENTHNRAGGRIVPHDVVLRVAVRARELGLSLHLDGARIWNAAAATGRAEAELAAPFDTVSACFSKGLGAPAGSVIAGSRAHVAEALKLRKRLGGGMRQVGILAAGALHALEHHRARVADDHASAQAFAAALAGATGLAIDRTSVETNIVIFESHRVAPSDLASRAAERGVRISPFGGRTLRAVTHMDVTTQQCTSAGAIVAALADEG